MAILRGGKRIGGMDIRIGIPRDRSMDNINRDPRFKLKQVPIQQLQSEDFKVM